MDDVSELHISTATDGRIVAEADLRGDADVQGVIHEARTRGAQVLWAYGGDLDPQGFVREGGYTRLAAGSIPVEDSEPLGTTSDPDDLVELLRLGFLGQWGHKLPDREALARAAGRADVFYLVAAGNGGVCCVDRDERLIDAPGVVPEMRSAESYLSLLRAACALLGEGPATIESWGDPPERLASYGELGFEVVERLDGWTLEL